MLRWAVIDLTNTDEFMEPCNSLHEAITKAKSDWDLMTEHDKKRRVSFYVGLVNLDCDGKNWFYSSDEYGNIDADVRLIPLDLAKGEEDTLTFKQVLDASGMNMKEFSSAYDIPYRTIQNWAAGQEPQEYMLSLLAVAVFSNRK